MKYLLNAFLKASVENPFFRGYTSTNHVFANERLKILHERAEFYRQEIEKLQKHINSNYGGTRWIEASAHLDAAEISGNPNLYHLCRKIEQLADKKAQVEQEIAKINKKEKRKKYEIAKVKRKQEGKQSLLDKIDNIVVFIRVWSRRILILFIIILGLKTCLAQTQNQTEWEYKTGMISSNVLVSQDGNLKIRQLRSYQEACVTGKPSDSYYLKDGVSGVLYPSQCGQYGGDIAEYKFIDIGGNERCTGKAVIGLGEREAEAVTFWEIEDAVSGHVCSTIGKTYEIKMHSLEIK